MIDTRITIVRHGETMWNRAMQLQGHQDSPLTEEGVAQAEMLAETICNKTFDICISSDLGRTKHTTSIINRHLKLDVIYNERLRERAFGVMESRFQDELKQNLPEVWDGYINRIPDFQIPEGESLIQFNNRIIGELEKIANQYSGKHVLVVAHGGVLDCVIRRIFNIELDRPRCFNIYNTSVNSFTIKEDQWILEQWGNVEHLQQTKVLDEVSK